MNKFYSSLRTRNIVEPEFIYTKNFRSSNVPKRLDIDYSTILGKPFFVKNFAWAGGATKYSQINTLKIPKDILTNELAKIPFKTSVMYKAKISLVYQVAGTPMHQGVLLVSAFPNGAASTIANYGNKTFVNKFISCPHVFLHANEATSAKISIPFYVNGEMQMTDEGDNTFNPMTGKGNYAVVMTTVMNQLSCPVLATTSVSVSVHAVFEELEFYVPHVDMRWVAQSAWSGLTSAISKGADGLVSLGKRTFGDIFDGLRGAFKYYTGLHNPNNPSVEGKVIISSRQNTNNVDIETTYEKMDPYADFSRTTKDFIFETDQDEMLISHILSKPQFLGVFTVSKNDSVGKLLWNNPITPFQAITPLSITNDIQQKVAEPALTNNIAVLSALSRYWKGGLKLHLQASMTNFHFCKLEVARNYSPVLEQIGKAPMFEDVQSLMVDSMEFSGGGQVQTISLPYISTMDMLPVSTDWLFNALQHGMYYIYLSQQIISSGGVPDGIEFNVYLSADEDFQLFGYSTLPLHLYHLSLSGFEDLPDPADEEQTIRGFIAESAVIQPISDQAELTEPGITSAIIPNDKLRPIVSVREYIRRLYRVHNQFITKETFNTTTGLLTFDVGELLGVSIQKNTSNTYFHASPLGIIKQMFLGVNGGMRFKVVLSGITNATVWYVPPGYFINTTSATDKLCWQASTPIGNVPENVNSTNYQKHQFQVLGTDAGTYDFHYSSPTMVIERPNYINPNSIVVNKDASISDRTIPAGGCIIEGHIPNMSPYKFVGDGYQIYGHDDEQETQTSTSAMGHLVISIPEPYLAAPGSAFDEAYAKLSIFAGFDDEARLGYHINSPTVLVPCVLGKAAGKEIGFQVSPYCYNKSVLNTNPLPLIGITDDTLVSKSYSR